MPASQRIALVRQRYNPFGGAERFIERALASLERLGAEVTLIAREWRDASARRVLRVNPPYIGSLWRDAGFARAARAAWTRERFDLVQSHERIPGCDVYRAGDGVHRQWLEYRLQAASRIGRSKVRANPYHRYVCKVERSVFEHPRLRAVICNSEMVRADVLRHFCVAEAKVHVIYNGVDLDHFHPRHRAALRAQARSTFGCADRDLLFAFVGSGFERKGLACAIDALARAGDTRMRLAVAGRDRDAAHFAARARGAGVADRVQLLGGVDDVRPLFAAADCFILPTLYDPFPSAALEALAMGVPLIVSRRCGAAELVRTGENGWTCDAHDPAGLEILLGVAAEAVRDGKMLAAARASAEGFGIDEMATKLTALYAALGRRSA
ncbi:MAG: glycosyltransferase family 4 protein [Burkholderiales bacterium]